MMILTKVLGEPGLVFQLRALLLERIKGGYLLPDVRGERVHHLARHHEVLSALYGAARRDKLDPVTLLGEVIVEGDDLLADLYVRVVVVLFHLRKILLDVLRARPDSRLREPLDPRLQVGALVLARDLAVALILFLIQVLLEKNLPVQERARLF